MLKFLILLGLIGHLICWRCDCLLTYTPNGRFQFSDLKDSAQMAKTFDGFPLKRPMASMLLGVFSMLLSFWGYFGLYRWMADFSQTFALLILVPAVLFYFFGVAHHVFCGVAEWFYVRFGRTNEARKAALEFFKPTLPFMGVCYISLLTFAVSFFIAVVGGYTALPRWCCIWNLLPYFVCIAPFRVVGAANLACVWMFLGLLIFI
ncbi:MAG: hypothetical protein IJ234_04115 [Clostridia bacterium]|nr:hypothetical protein [Clostridia bacterium]